MKKTQTFLALTTAFTLFNSTASFAITASPENWWVGMQNDSLQVMLYDNNIANKAWQMVPYKGVEFKGVTTTNNPNYAFLDLTISDNAKAGTLTFKAEDGTTFTYPLNDRDKQSANRHGFTNRDTLYLINPDRFVNGDPSNDSVAGMQEAANPSFKGGRHGGDIQGVINSLDYLEDLGVTATLVNTGA